jgi:hypothetical protein
MKLGTIFGKASGYGDELWAVIRFSVPRERATNSLVVSILDRCPSEPTVSSRQPDLKSSCAWREELESRK